jgi:hypothetical protein
VDGFDIRGHAKKRGVDGFQHAGREQGVAGDQIAELFHADAGIVDGGQGGVQGAYLVEGLDQIRDCGLSQGRGRFVDVGQLVAG